MNYVDIPPERLLLVLGILLACALTVSQRAGLDLGRALLVGALRGAVQLLAVGYFLLLLFEHERPLWVLLVAAFMLTVAAVTSARRVDCGPGQRALVLRAFAAIAAGALLALVPVFAFVVAPTPWYEARYLIPISGMIVANAMNIVAQVYERVFASARDDRAEIEQWLALGATPKQALARQTRAALRAALIPTINGLLTVGLVSLPGMMTGQIVGGVAPVHAVRYQIVIMYQLVIVASVSGGVAVWLARRLLFTPRAQLRRF